jgi:hypothetical protein
MNQPRTSWDPQITQIRQIPWKDRREIICVICEICGYCAVQKLGDTLHETAQSGGESEEGRRPAPLGRARGEG